MARRTTNYGWNISEGTDIVNPLTDIFPNFESQDTDLKNVSDCSIGTATELKTGTVHALTRDDSDKDVFKFTATSNFTAGDTFTVDGDQVSALTTAGEQLQTGCYIIGSEVLVLKKGTLLTMYVSSDNAVTLDGHSASYFATASDLSNTDGDVSALSTKVGTATLTTTAPDLSGAVNELNSNLSREVDHASDGIAWGTQIAYMETVFDALNAEDKRRAIIQNGNGLIVRVADINSKLFNGISIVDGTKMICYTLDLTNHTAKSITIESGSVTFNSIGTNINPNRMTMYLV